MGQWEVLIYRRLRTMPPLKWCHRLCLTIALPDAYYARNLEKVVWLHRAINDRVQRQTKAALHSRLQLGDIRINSEGS